MERQHAALQAHESPAKCFFLENKTAACSLDFLEWDSQALKMRVARIGAFFSSNSRWYEPDVNELVAEIEDKLVQRRIGFASCRIGFENLELAKSLSACGWEIRDVMNIYNAPQGQSRSGAAANHEIISINQEEISEYIDEFSDAFRFSRIHEDPRIPPSLAAQFYRNMCAEIFQNPSSIAVGILHKGTLAGIAIGSHDLELSQRIGRKIAYLWQIVIFERFRGFGLSLPLLAAFTERFQDADIIEVGTQVNNLAANRLYSKAGLRLMANAITFHKWLD
jgi:ribosomal protein S18 acetylase RimI-like enzyme